MVKIYFTIDENNRLNERSSTSMRREDEYCIEVDENHEVLHNARVFKYENDELIKDIEYQKQLIEESNREESEPTESELSDLAMIELMGDLINGCK
ncbi:hypothetical protein ABEW03_16010 [Virgibacillus pantothenticus]|uniref:hypothetical protein n=1 Tax=Virgibacillus pantothenticus TaxID=1473 RepID=UPI003D2AB0FF